MVDWLTLSCFAIIFDSPDFYLDRKSGVVVHRSAVLYVFIVTPLAGEKVVSTYSTDHFSTNSSYALII